MIAWQYPFETILDDTRIDRLQRSVQEDKINLLGFLSIRIISFKTVSRTFRSFISFDLYVRVFPTRSDYILINLRIHTDIKVTGQDLRKIRLILRRFLQHYFNLTFLCFITDVV